jgi:hypothetical protein
VLIAKHKKQSGAHFFYAAAAAMSGTAAIIKITMARQPPAKPPTAFSLEC